MLWIAASGYAGAAPQSAATWFRPGLAAHALLGLANGTLLLWHGDGRIQLRGAEGRLSEVIHLPLRTVLDVQLDLDGFAAIGPPLLADQASGAQTGSGSMVVRLSNEGVELERWAVPDPRAWRLWIDGQGRHAVTPSAVWPLLPGGAIGPAEPVTDDRGLPIILGGEGEAVWCYFSDVSLLGQRRGSCRRKGAFGWAFNADFLVRPLRCGSVLAVISHAGHPELALYSLGTGKLLVRRPHEGSARMVCDDGRGLLLAGPSPKLLSLPSGRLIWEGPKGLRSIDDLAVTRNTLFWRDGRTALIWTMALPKSAGKPLPR